MDRYTLVGNFQPHARLSQGGQRATKGKGEKMSHPLVEASKEYESLFSGWFKNLSGISTGALALLVSLMPKEQPPRPDKYFLAVCWTTLILSILFALIASFRQIILARVNLDFQQAQLTKPTDKTEYKIASGFLSPRTKMRIVIFSQVVAIVSFCVSFISLAIYAILRTL
jgi:hypothetical protein